MENILSENRRLLTRYLSAVGCNPRTVFRIVTPLDEEQVIEMLEFCHDNPNASEAELYGMSLTICTESKDM